MAKSLEGKVAIITGGGSGIGAVTVELFLEHGAKVAAFDINVPEKASENSSRLDIRCNVASDADVKAAVQDTVDKFGRVDILVNCAGVMDGVEPVADVPDHMWEKIMSVNLNGPFYLMRACIPHFLNNEPSTPGAFTKGCIVNISSIAGRSGASAGASYSASKAGLLGLTKSTAYMYHRRGIRTNAILPGTVKTNIYPNSGLMSLPNGGINLDGIKMVKPFHDMCPTIEGGGMDPVNIAEAVLYLATADKVNGTELVVDGGWTTV